MNTAVALVLNKVLGDWLEGIDSSSFNLSLMSGEVRLGPIQVKPDAINQLGFPFTLKCGFVDKILVKVPVFSLGSKQMVIDIDGVYIYASPRTKDDWNPDTELNNQKKAKKGQLDGFELMNKEQLPEDPGFTGRLVAKIIDNLQINIAGVYIRYVDSISSNVPFALGIILKKMELFTCNDKWEMEFREDPKMTLKRINIENLAVFLDYSAGDTVLLPVTAGKSEKELFEEIARSEVSSSESPFHHRYLIHPLFLEVKAKLSKDPSNTAVPQIEAMVDLGKKKVYPFRFAFEAPQATHLMRCGAFFGEFKTFQTGVLSTMIQGPFGEEEGMHYRELYSKWRAFVLGDNAKKAQALLPQLESFEDAHSFEDIAKQRKVAIRDFELAEAERTLNTQLSQLAEPVAEGRVSRLKGYVGWGATDDDKKKKEEDRKKERDKVEAALQLAREKREKFRHEMTSFVAEDRPVFETVTDVNYNRMKLHLTIHGYVFEIGGEHQVYMYTSMKQLSLDTTLRATTMDVKLIIVDFKVEDKLVAGSLYPYILETEGLQFVMEQPPTGIGKFKLKTKKLKAVANIECLLGLAGEMMRATSGLVDIHAISKTASSRSEKYIEAGRKYMQKAISGKYERHPMDLDVELQAPCFVVPLDLRVPRDTLTIDLGLIKATTKLAPDLGPSIDPSTHTDKSQLYDRYSFFLQSAKIYTESRTDTVQSPIFEPKGVTIDVGVCVSPKHKEFPAIEVYITNEEVPLLFSDMQLYLLLRIKDQVMHELAANMPVRVNLKPEEEQAKVEQERAMLEEKKKQEVQRSDGVICQHVYILFQRFTVDLYSKGNHVFNFSMVNSLLVVTMTSEGNIIIDYKLDEIFAYDKRPNVYWNRILGDPIMQRTKQDELGQGTSFLSLIKQEYVRTLHNAESEQWPAKDCDFFIRLAVLRGGKEIKGVIRLGEMCVTVNPDSMQTLMDIPQEAFRLLAASKPALSAQSPSLSSIELSRAVTFLSTVGETKILSHSLSELAVNVQILVDCAELRLPLDSHDKDSKIFSFYVETDMLYRSEEEYRYGRNFLDRVVSIEPIRVEKEVRIDVYRIGMVIGYGTESSGIKGRDAEKGDLVKPCRLNLGYSQDWEANSDTNQDKVMRSRAELSLETFELVIGFRDMDFFKSLGKHWAKPPSDPPAAPQAPTSAASPQPQPKKSHSSIPPPPSEFRLDFRTECLQLDLCDDTRNTLIPLIRSQMGNMSASIVVSDKEFNLSFAGSTETSYYNTLVASWEPLMEFWMFELVAMPSGAKGEDKKKLEEEKKKPEDSGEKAQKEYLQFEGAHPLSLQFKSMSPFRVNVTYSMIHTMSVMLKTLGEDSSSWEAEKQSEIAGEKGMMEATKIFYKMKNRTGNWVDLRVDGMDVDNGSFHLDNDSSCLISQTTFEKAAGRTLSLQRYNSLLQAPQAPSTLTLHLSDSSTIQNIAVDKLGIFVYQSASDGGSLVVVEITPKISHVSVVLESGFKLVNNSPERVLLHLRGTEERLEIDSLKATAVPVSWTKGLNNITIVTEFGEELVKKEVKRKENDEEADSNEVLSVRLSEKTYVVLDSVMLPGKNVGLAQEIVLLNPPLRVQNYLPFPLALFINSESQGEPARVDPGDEVCVYHLDPSQSNTFKWVMDLGFDKGRKQSLHTDFVKIKDEDEQHYKLEGDIPCDKLSLSNKRKVKFSVSRECDIVFRKCEEEKFFGKLVSVYNQYWIVNHTDFPLEFTGKKDFLQIAPHTIGMVKTKQKSLQVRLSALPGGYGEVSDFSQKFNITTTGVAGLIKLVNPERIAKAGNPTEVYLGLLIAAGQKPIVKSTVIHIHPRYVVTNYTTGKIFVRQNGLEIVKELEPKQSLHYQFENGSKPKNLQISSDKENWSSPFSLDEIEDFQVRYIAPEALRVKDGKWWQASEANGNMMYTRVVVSTETEATLFVSLLEPADPEILIKNESNSPISISQLDVPIEISLPPRSTLPFAYDNRLLPVKKVLFKTFSAQRTYVLDKMKDIQKPLGDLSVTVEPDMSSRVVFIRELAGNSEFQGQLRLIANESRFSNMNIAVILPGFELSLHDEVPAERFLLYVMNIRLKVKMSDGAKREADDEDGAEVMRHATQFAVKLDIQHVQLDNMSNSSSEFPIIFGGTDKFAASSVPIDPTIPITPFIQVAIIKDHIETLKSLPDSPPTVSSAFNRFSYINVTIQEMQAKVHQDTVTGLIAVVAKLQSGFAEDPSLSRKISKRVEFSLENIIPALKAAAPVLSYDPGTVASKVYLSALQMNALKIILSFKTGRKQELDLDPRRGFGMLGLLSRIGGAFITITDSTLHFSSVIICDSFQTMASLIGLVVKNYVKQGILQFYRILGSSDLIGNPIGLIDKLGTGVFEFFSEPVKGLMKASPKEFANGVGKGVKSLVGSVVSGGFGSVSKITGSLYTVVREVGGDEESAKRINSTDNVAEGVFHGVTGGIVDLTEGMTGIFTKPWHGAKKGGMTGFLKGVSSGVVGAVTAPLSAVLRVSTSVTASVVAQAMLLDDKIRQAGRMRFPRQFGARKVLEAYSSPLGHAQFVLVSQTEFQGEDLVFYGRIDPQESVILTQRNLFYIKRFEIIAHIPLLSMDFVTVEKIRKSKATIGFRLVANAPGVRVIIPCKEFPQLAKLYKALFVLRKILRIKPAERPAVPIKVS